jgi:hypothetical protein
MSLNEGTVQAGLGPGPSHRSCRQITPVLKIPKKRTILILVALVLARVCTPLPAYFRARESVQWPTTRGVISVSRLQVGYLKQLKGYWPDIQYDYRIGGTQYHGTQLSFNRVHLAVQEASQRTLDPYPVGKVLSVYYDPKNPDFAVLVPGLRGEIAVTFYLDIFFIVLSISAFLWIMFYA